MPTTGRNAVKTSASMANAITQWNMRATNEWRSMFAGSPGRAASMRSTSPASRL